MKQSNIVIFLLLVLGAFFLRDSIHISTNLLSLFASKQSVEKLKIANNLGYSKEMLVAIKGFDKAAKKELKEVVKALRKLPEVESLHYSLTPTQQLQEYYKEYYPLLADFNATQLSKEQIKQRVQKLYDTQLDSFFYTAINRDDPLDLFHLTLTTPQTAHRGSLMSLGEYGYLIRVRTKVTASDMNKAKQFYDKLQKIFAPYPNLVAFAPFFYTVENSAAFQADVEKIVILSTILLLFIYAWLLKNIKLLFQTLIALGSSMLFATLVTTTTIENFNILSLAFGMSLSAVSIDYLLHYHFHNFYASAKRIDKNVLYGFLTTVTAFGILAFIPIALIAQISIFSLLSLSFAYMLFTTVFPHIGLEPYLPKEQTTLKQKEGWSVSSRIVLGVSLLLILYSASRFQLNTNLRDLDYQNTKLRASEALFGDAMKSKLSPVIVQAKDENQLIERLSLLKQRAPSTLSLASFVLTKEQCEAKKAQLQNYDFSALQKSVVQEAQSVGFKKGYFHDAYSFAQRDLNCTLPPLQIFESLSLSTYKTKDLVYSVALIAKREKGVVENLSFVEDLNVKKIFQRSSEAMYDALVVYGGVVLGVVFILLLVSVKEHFVFALNYILFPSALSIAVITTLGSVNIMHLFSLIILVAIGIDYGIYMSNSTQQESTMLAIKYSLLSTFGAFGVLVFSSIVALNSIGLVITLGCGAIYILIKVMR